MATSYSPKIKTDNLILYVDAMNIKSNLKKGFTWYDLSGNRIDATMEAGSYVDNYMRLNGTTDAFQFGHDLKLESQTFTISAWVNLSDRRDRHILITKWLGWSFEISSTAYPYLRLNGSSPGDLTSTVAITFTNWHNITATFNGTGNDRVIAVDGATNNSATASGSITYNQATFNIPYLNNPIYSLGKISTLQIWDVALTEAEITNNYDATKGRYI